MHDDPVAGQKSGMPYLLPCLESHQPGDLVVLMLGTNDFNQRFAKTEKDITLSARRLVSAVKTCEFGPAGRSPQVLLLIPPPVARLREFAEVLAGAT